MKKFEIKEQVWFCTIISTKLHIFKGYVTNVVDNHGKFLKGNSYQYVVTAPVYGSNVHLNENELFKSKKDLLAAITEVHE